MNENFYAFAAASAFAAVGTLVVIAICQLNAIETRVRDIQRQGVPHKESGRERRARKRRESEEQLKQANGEEQ